MVHRKCLTLISVVVTCVAAALAYAALQGEAPAGVAKGPLEARLRPLRGSWREGEVPRLSLELRNLGETLLRVPRCLTLLRLEVDGESVTLRGPSTAPYVSGLAPGEWTISAMVPVDGDRGAPVERLKLSRGAHTVRVALDAEDLKTGETLHVASDTAEVEMLAADAAAAEGAGTAGDELDARRATAARTAIPKSRLAICLVVEPSDGRIVESLDPAKLVLGDVPLLDERDIESYDWDTHTIALKPAALRRLPSPGVWGLPFVVVVDGGRSYAGAFWSPISSYLPRLPYCSSHRLAEADGAAAGTIRIEPPPIDGTKDPRGDGRILEVLRVLGKLKTGS